MLKLGDAADGVLLGGGGRAVVTLAGALAALALADGLERLGVRALGGRGIGHGRLGRRGRRRLLRLRHRLAGFRFDGWIVRGVGVGVGGATASATGSPVGSGSGSVIASSPSGASAAVCDGEGTGRGEAASVGRCVDLIFLSVV